MDVNKSGISAPCHVTQSIDSMEVLLKRGSNLCGRSITKTVFFKKTHISHVLISPVLKNWIHYSGLLVIKLRVLAILLYSTLVLCEVLEPYEVRLPRFPGFTC